MTKLERKAAMLVAAAAAGVAVSGVRLAKKHAKYLAEKAAATFKDGDGDEIGDEWDTGLAPEEMPEGEGDSPEKAL